MFKNYLALRRWRRSIKPGDFVAIDGLYTKYKVHVVEGKEVTIFDHSTGDYETYKRKHLTPPKY